MDNPIEICLTSWKTEDLISELSSILQGVSVDDVDNKLIKYVVENIEPCGWNAVWQPAYGKGTDLHQDEDLMTESFIVEVKHVCMNSLDAHVFVTDGVTQGMKSKQIDNHYVNMTKKVPLTQLFLLAQQENDQVNIAVTAEVVELVRFFFDHIWLPWDLEEDFCYYEKSLISKRVQLYEDLVNNCIPVDISKNLQNILIEAKMTRLKIDEIKLSADDVFHEDIQEDNLVEVLKLHRLLFDLKASHESLRDPVLRGINAYNQRLERRNLIESLSSMDNDGIVSKADILLVCSAASPEELVLAVLELPELLKNLPGISKDAKIKTFPFLQLALDSCKTGDTILLLPGKYTLSHLGDLANGGTICGLKGIVEIMGCSSNGDVMMDLNLDIPFTLRSVQLLPLKDQSAIVAHYGQLVMENCSIIDCSVGVTLLSESRCQMLNCVIETVILQSLICRKGSQLTILDSTSKNILKGTVLLETGAKIINQIESTPKEEYF